MFYFWSISAVHQFCFLWYCGLDGTSTTFLRYFILSIPPLLSQMPWPRSKVVEENGVEVILSQKRWAPSKMKFVLELLTAVVWPQWEISNSAMLIVPVVVRIYLEHCFDEVSHLFIALIEIWRYTCVGVADYKEHCFCATEKGVREEKGKWEIMYPNERKGSPTGRSNQTAVLRGRWWKHFLESIQPPIAQFSAVMDLKLTESPSRWNDSSFVKEQHGWVCKKTNIIWILMWTSTWWCSNVSGATSKMHLMNSFLDVVTFFQILFINFGGGTPYNGTESLVSRRGSEA